MARIVFVSVAIAALCATAAPAFAELPPQFTTWQDFAAVASQPSIPNLLGVVDAIERTSSGRFIVRGGNCLVEVVVTRESPKGPKGEIIVGGSHVAKVEVGQKRCTR